MNKRKPKRAQTPGEERANAWTHGLGVVFCLVAMPFLLIPAYRTGVPGVYWGSLAFGLGMLMVYISSTLYHAVQDQRLKANLRVADHISIYFLIAGTYTPLVANFLPGRQAGIFLLVLWSLVGLGLVFKLLYTDRFKAVSVVLYLIMGWMILFIMNPLRQQVPGDIWWWVIAGGLSYTVGVLFYVRSKVPYFHAVWHCFVLGGTVTHYVAVYKTMLLSR